MILISYGTRPEYLKVKKLINLLGPQSVRVVFVTQHQNIVFGEYDYKIEIQDNNNRLDDIISSVLIDKQENIFEDIKFSIVQGDTASALSIALKSFHRKIPVIHLEAGLRTHDWENPYPEEIYRQIISRISTYHLCPTENNKKNLLSESIDGNNIFVVGNTVLDNIRNQDTKYGNKVLITLHRRENHNIISEWFCAIEKIAKKYPDLEFILPIHPNPNVKKHEHLLNTVKVTEPLEHEKLISTLAESRLVITDSGGIQEEGSFLNKKMIVCRKITERPESVGIHSFLCSEPCYLENLFDSLYQNYQINEICPFGNGYSCEKIINILKKL